MQNYIGHDLYAVRTHMTAFGPGVRLFGLFNPWARAIAELCKPFFSDLPKPVFGIKEVELRGSRVAVREEVVLKKAFCSLLRFSHDKSEGLPRVLIVAPLSGHYATLLRDTVRTFVADHEIFVTDWANARDVPLSEGEFSLETYVTYLQDCFRFLNRNGEFHVLAVCQPSVPALVATALEAQTGGAQPASLILIGGSIDARVSPTAVNRYATKTSLAEIERRSVQKVPVIYSGRGRKVYPGFLQFASFVGLNYGLHFHAHVDRSINMFFGNLAEVEKHDKFYDEYNSVMDLAAEYYLETVRRVFQDFELPRGVWKTNGVLVDPGAIRHTALLTCEGARDNISGAGQTKAAHELCTGLSGALRKHLAVEAGHYGLFSGSTFRSVIYPDIRDFIAENRKN